MPIAYMVACLDDDGSYTAATHRTFANRADADRYAATVAAARKPIVVSLYKSLRVEEG